MTVSMIDHINNSRKPVELPECSGAYDQPVGLIDWLTLRLDLQLLRGQFLGPGLTAEYVVQKLRKDRGRILKISANGETEWETFARESIKSDSHQLTISIGSCIEITGSPARLMSGNNVFGSLDIRRCAQHMINFAALHLGVVLPARVQLWRCTRIDITRNYAMRSLQEVHQALDYLKHVDMAHQKASSHHSTVMWGKGSQLHSGKAYAKGPQAQKQQRQKKSKYSDLELEKAQKILRLEYVIRGTLMDRYYE